MRRVEIFDITLRDGEQSPGISLSVEEKVEIARQLGWAVPLWASLRQVWLQTLPLLVRQISS
jgi:hypothetical protein